jgi:hypothetical protein
MIDVTQPALAVNSIKLTERKELDMGFLYYNIIHIFHIILIFKKLLSSNTSFVTNFAVSDHHAVNPT